MASTRLRKAFKYPTDEDDNDPAEGIDEQGIHNRNSIRHSIIMCTLRRI
jgi:hypothetical protein